MACGRPQWALLSASLIFGAQQVPNEPIPIFANDEDRAGLIFRPGHTPVECAKAGDSAGKCDLGSWCPSLPPSSYPTDPSGVAAWRNRMDTLAVEVDSIHVSLDGCGRAWRPADISAYLERTTAVQLHFQHLSYNEWIVGPPTAWEAALPELVEAFFVSANVKPELLARTRKRGISSSWRSTLNMRCHSWCWMPRTGRRRLARLGPSDHDDASATCLRRRTTSCARRRH